MKKLFASGFLFIVLLAGTSALAQQRSTTQSRSTNKVNEADVPYNLIKINPLSLFTRTGSVFYERVLNEHTSVQLGVQYTLPRRARILGTDILGPNGELNRFAITPEFRYYPSGNAPTGFYLAPFARYANLSAKGDITRNVGGQPQTFQGKVTLHTYSIGGLIGGQFLFGEHISLDAYLGPYFSVGSLSISQNVTKEDYKIPASINFPVWLRAGFTVGYAF